MEEEILFGLFWGMVFGTPVGWFLRSAAQWRREARRALTQAPVQPAVPPPPVPAAETRAERLLERLNQRMETLEDRIDFTERLLDARGSHARAEGQDTKVHPIRETTPQR